MDMMEKAIELKHLLCIHDETNKKIQQLENILKEHNQRLFQATVAGHHEFQHQYLLRLSIMEGYKLMCLRYRKRVCTRIQELSNLILQTSQEEEGRTVINESPTRRLVTDLATRRLVTDKMAQPEIENFCLMCRSQ
ncbi:uncharacterized protein LOC111136316 [Crassostrea virginica]|uniref:Uncharacterized protein LOC111136316 n=1 Tax=Crassostrea virginica TaxID=6565 RepID=A0A8B8ES95_CRAVI|nr:uncharacterized protein LOC111136316 [Crassostrea virginica]